MRANFSVKNLKSYAILIAFVGAFVIVAMLAFKPIVGTSLKDTTRAWLIKNVGLSDVGPVAASLSGDSFKNLLMGKYPAELETIELDIKSKHWAKLSDERDSAQKIGVLYKPESYPAKIHFKGRKYKAKIRLKGDLPDHRTGPDRWSLRVVLRDGATIFGMKTFSLHKPSSRQAPDDMLFEAWMRGAGVMGTRHEFIRVSVNGETWGVMNVEEHPTKSMLELSGRKNAPLMRIGQDESLTFRYWNIKVSNVPHTWYGDLVHMPLYNKKKNADKPLQMALYSYIVRAYRAFLVGEVEIENLVDVDAYSKVLIAAAIWNNPHVLSWSNMKQYINPYTFKLEPITGDQGWVVSLEGKNQARASHFSVAASQPLFRALMRSDIFFDHYDQNFSDVRSAMVEISKEHEKICSVFPIDCPKFDFTALNVNLAFIEKEGANYFRNLVVNAPRLARSDPAKVNVPETVPPRDDVSYPLHIAAEYYSSGRLKIWNLLTHNILISKITLKCRRKANCPDNELIDRPIRFEAGYDGLQPAQITVQVPPKMHLNSNRYLDIVSYVGSQKNHERVKITLDDTVENPLLIPSSLTNLLKDHPYIKEMGTDLRISFGDWAVKTPILIPRGKRFVIDAGTTLTFVPTAYVLSHSPLVVSGTKAAPVHLKAEDGQTWGGIYVMGRGGRNILSHAVFSNTRAFQAGSLSLTGGVTFYDVDVTLNHVVFDGTQAEDALNTVNSNFVVQNTHFRNTVSDAFDSDFSIGTVENLSFTHIGGDGLDVSGTKVRGSGLVFEDVFDKGVSAGEASDVTLSDVQAHNIGVAVAAKDASHLGIDGLQVEDSQLYAGMVYIKKEMYGAASMMIENTTLKAEDFLNQSPSTLVLNGLEIVGQSLDVDQLYSSGPMKK